MFPSPKSGHVEAARSVSLDRELPKVVFMVSTGWICVDEFTSCLAHEHDLDVCLHQGHLVRVMIASNGSEDQCSDRHRHLYLVRHK
jgi:hypothetical protein